MIANAHRDPRRGGAFLPADFMPFGEDGHRARTTREPLTDPARWRALKAHHKKNLVRYAA